MCVCIYMYNVHHTITHHVFTRDNVCACVRVCIVAFYMLAYSCIVSGMILMKIHKNVVF